MKLSKEEKKALRKSYTANQEKKKVLTKKEASRLFDFLDEKLEQEGCDNTLKYTMEWLNSNIDKEKIPSVLEEIEEMGGFCDCEVIYNCYEDYDLA